LICMNSAATESEPYRLACRHCRRPNPVGRRFCGGCGKPLWETCPRCGTECAAEETFCGACGADIASSWDEERQQFTARIERAHALADGHHYDRAIDELRALRSVSDPRLEPYAAQAGEELERILRRRADEVAKAETTLTSATALMSAFSYERAQQALEEVPVP